MSPKTTSHLRRALLIGASLTAVAGAVACDVAQELLKGAWAPSAALARVDLVDSPSVNTLMAWGCYQYVGATTCTLLGFDGAPSDDQLRFSFDTVFDLLNPNESFSIPLVETLLGVQVFDGTNLGVLCVSFCDPADASCEPAQDAEGGCQVDGSSELGAGDLVPTVEQLVALATDVATGTLADSWDYRTIPPFSEQSCQLATCTEESVDGVSSMCCGGVCEPLATGCSVGTNTAGESCAMCEGYTQAHLQFDFDVDAMMGLLGPLVEDGVNDLLDGRSVSLSVPYALEGTLFFDAPELGRYSLGYGPFEDQWDL